MSSAVPAATAQRPQGVFAAFPIPDTHRSLRVREILELAKGQTVGVFDCETGKVHSGLVSWSEICQPFGLLVVGDAGPIAFTPNGESDARIQPMKGGPRGRYVLVAERPRRCPCGTMEVTDCAGECGRLASDATGHREPELAKEIIETIAGDIARGKW